MCCFSRPVSHVARTRIFARPTLSDRQVVVYQMQFAAEEALAMILPVPFKPGAGPGEFKFINLSAYPEFFSDLNSGFPEIHLLAPAAGGAVARATKSRLEVFQVGAFEASFVPTLAEFDRLDPRFRIDPAIWRSVSGYDRMGFAVFKLKAGRQEVHPMCFAFPRADATQLFFPTLHIHDGQVHPTETFDHTLYAQGNDQQAPAVLGWDESMTTAAQFMKTERTAGILQNAGHVYRRRIVGPSRNEDTLVPLS